MVEPYWIRVRDQVTKKEWLINPTRLAEILKEHTDLKQLLGVCNVEEKNEWLSNAISLLNDRLIAFERQVAVMFLPQARVSLLLKLRDAGALDTKQLNKFIESQSPLIMVNACQLALDQLVAEGLIYSESNPVKYHPKMWFLKDDPELLTQLEAY